ATKNAEATFRIVVKSLPSVQLIEYLMERMKTRSLMVFHQPFLSRLSSVIDDQADVLLGKPMPIKTAESYYRNLPDSENGFNPYKQVQWLVDTEKRIDQYADLGEKLGHPLRLNIEIDIGLHRGGIRTLNELRTFLKRFEKRAKHIVFSGLMGYDPHIVKIPGFIRSQANSLRKGNAFYEECKQLLKTEFPRLWREDLTFNGAGSPTVHLHKAGGSPLNDISAGSFLVKPTTFDLPSLGAYKPACYIATPVLKKLKGTKLPGLEGVGWLLRKLKPAYAHSYFIYGGFWKADYHYPKGFRQNSIFGSSTNQSMLNGPKNTQLEVDDFVFLRPHQSEFVFLQFEEILLMRNMEIVGGWSLLNSPDL
ncbi:MAG: alanine racemase, partial [Bacteroidota bacterium]